MRVRKIINKPVKLDRDGIHLAGGMNVVLNANIETGSHSSATSHQDVPIVQGTEGAEKGRTHTGDPHKEVEHD